MTEAEIAQLILDISFSAGIMGFFVALFLAFFGKRG